MSLKRIAVDFGRALDQDNFSLVASLVDEACIYELGDDWVIGPQDIAASYEKNMLEGRAKLDELVWGESGIEEVSDRDDQFIIHFTDHIKHQGQSFIHRCQQRVTVNKKLKIARIVHIDNEAESERLREFFKRVGVQ